MLPHIHVVVIPNKYATEKGREEVLAYSRKYHEENREWERFKNNKRRHLNRIEKSKKEGLIEDGKSFNKLIIDLSNNVSNMIFFKNFFCFIINFIFVYTLFHTCAKYSHNHSPF